MVVMFKPIEGHLGNLFKRSSLLPVPTVHPCKKHIKNVLSKYFPFLGKIPVLIPDKMEMISTANLIARYNRLPVDKLLLSLLEGVNLTIYSHLL